ncbi:hypothetical protein [Acidocella sp.]|jgi:hypothetical protein|uniref:hypothetical protein n=1 Tax=Acidocella sp. TaxID=50710 RepID=UPI002F3EF142
MKACAQADTSSGHELFAPVSGIWVFSSQQQDKNTKSKLYGATSPSANWVIGQWDIPHDLPPFFNNVTQNSYASVRYNGIGHFTLQQNATTLPCTVVFPSGKRAVNEFDLFVGSIPLYETAYPKTLNGKREPLSSLSHIFETATVRPTTIRVADTACPVTRAVIGTGIVATDLETRQTFFYQISFSIYQADQRKMTLAQLQPAWFFTGTNTQAGAPDQFGYGDRVWSSYGVSPATQNNVTAFDLDVLPRLKQLIFQGAKYGMDQNLANWAVTGLYYGQSAFGHVAYGSAWSGLSLMAN